ncbi:MAG: MFS transporter [Bacteroidales bacterium]
MKYISRTVWILSLISLFTDMASEMLYPVMPVYLKSIGFSVLIIGILEGLAEATAGLSKGYFGKLSDQTGKRVPFVRIGYAMSAISKPMLALFIYPVWVFLARTADRMGKGIRTGARDAILSAEAVSETKGKIFGFHRSMDTLGAVIGPSVALVYLAYFPGNYKTLFFFALVPGIIAILASGLLKEKPVIITPGKENIHFFSFLKYWKQSPPAYRRIVAGFVVFTLFNSSDIFLLLKAKDAGISDTSVIGIYIFYNLVYAAFAFPMGILADKLGLKKIFIAGMFLFSITYFGMGFNQNTYGFYALFLIYGLFAAASEGISKAWISNTVDPKDTATAIGTFSAFQSIGSLIASSLAGVLWIGLGARAVFMASGSAAILVAVYFLRLK